MIHDEAGAPRAEPLVPAECDLRNFLRMPLQVQRLLASDTWIAAADDPRLGHALVSLWAEAWQQVPAGSLPDADRILQRLSMCPDAAEWQRIKPAAMAGWSLCSDGRWYHPTVCEMALEAWVVKLQARLRGGRGNAAQHGAAFDEDALLGQIARAAELLRALNPMSEALSKAQQQLARKPARAPRASRAAAPPAALSGVGVVSGDAGAAAGGPVAGPPLVAATGAGELLSAASAGALGAGTVPADDGYTPPAEALAASRAAAERLRLSLCERTRSAQGAHKDPCANATELKGFIPLPPLHTQAVDNSGASGSGGSGSRSVGAALAAAARPAGAGGAVPRHVGELLPKGLH